MSGLPHNRPAPALGDIVIKGLGGFDFGDDGRAGLGLENIAGEEHHELVTPEYLAAFIYHPDTIRIAIVRDAYVRSRLAHFANQILEIGDAGGIGRMVGKSPIDLDIHRGHPTTQEP